jgi:hypothetical protein
MNTLAYCTSPSICLAQLILNSNPPPYYYGSPEAYVSNELAIPERLGLPMSAVSPFRIEEAAGKARLQSSPNACWVPLSIEMEESDNLGGHCFTYKVKG